MKLTTTYRLIGRLGLFEIAGERDLASACTFWSKLARQANRDNCACVFIRDQAIDKVTLHEIILIEKTIEESNLPRSLPIAILDEEASRERANRFGELVVQNRGWPLIRVFHRESEAWAWLDSLGQSLAPASPDAGGERHPP